MTYRKYALACATPLVLLGCSSEPAGESSPVEPGGTGPAVLVSTMVSNPEGRNVYVGAFPELPRGELDTSSMLEFGSSDVYTGLGYVFVWDRESATMTRFSVSADHRLQEGQTLGFGDYGLADSSVQPLFVGQASAYLVLNDQDTVIEWDPEAMLITRAFAAGLPAYPGMSTFAYSAGASSFDGKAVWNVGAENYDNLSYHAAAAVAFGAPGATRLSVVEDVRCAPNNKTYVLGGHLYVVGAGTNASGMKLYNSANAGAAPDCILRIAAGSEAFDPDYLLDLTAATGFSAIYGTWRFNETTLLVQGWDPADPFPGTIDEYWSGRSWITKTVALDVETGDVSDFGAIPKGIPANTIELGLDSVAYFQVVDPEGGAVTLNALAPGGLEPVFHARGEVWGFGRIR